MNKMSIYFNPDEAAVIGMALAGLLEDLSAPQPWNEAAKKDLKDVQKNARSAAMKLEKFAGIKCTLPEYNPGDENEFLNQN